MSSPSSPSVAEPASWVVGPGPLGGASRACRTLLIVNGLLRREVVIDGQIASELLGPQDILALDGPEEDPFAAEIVVTTLMPSRLAALDGALLSRLSAEQVELLLRRVGEQASRVALHRAVLQQPRVEDRLLGMLRLLAGRFGRVTPDGIRLPLALNHTELGHLVGARRPTISLAAKLLDDQRLLRRLEDGTWLICAPGGDVPAARETR